jgi:hypothetical protein
MRIDWLGLYPRTYMIEPWIADATGLSDFDWVRQAASFLVTSGPNFVSGANVSGAHGISFIRTSWALDVLDTEARPVVNAPTTQKAVV